MSAAGRIAPARWPAWLAVPLVAFALTRAVVFGGAYLADAALPMIHDTEPRGALGVWLRWDTVWYREIAAEGYRYTPGEMSSVAFFPLYPLLMRGLMAVTGDAVAAGLIISNICFLLALILLYRLTEIETAHPRGAGRTVLALAAFPTAFFFSAAYSESLFLLLSLGAVCAARRQQWGWMALAGVLGSATRALGLLIEIPVFDIWRKAYWRSGQRISQTLAGHAVSLLLIVLIPCGLAAFGLYLWRAFGDPAAFWNAQAAWGFQSLGPIAIILRDAGRALSGELPAFTFLNIGVFIIFAGLSGIIWKRLGAGYGLYTLLSVLIPMWSRTESMIRYALVLFPAFMLAAFTDNHPWLNRIYLIVCLPFQALFTALFVRGVFIG